MAEYDKIELRNSVQERMQNLGVSIREAADLAGVPHSAIQRVRSYQPVGAANFVLICDWVAIDPFDLVIKHGRPKDELEK